MATFININFDNSFNKKLLVKHLQFSVFWIIGIILFVFRIDVVLVHSHNGLDWLIQLLPTVYIIILLLSFFFQKWYWTLAFVLYPLLLFFWFIPKSVLKRGKVYMFGSYVDSVYRKIKNYKFTLLNLLLSVVTAILFLSFNSLWVRWLGLSWALYFYTKYVFRFLKRSFSTPSLFGTSIEQSINKWLENAIPEESIIVKSYINQKEDEKLETQQRKEKHLTRIIMANYTLDLLKARIGSFKSRKAFVLMWLFQAGMFLLYSIVFFWFINMQLYKIEPTNFIYKGSFPAFDFLYYTLKTITFGDINLVQPNTTITRTIETASFIIIGVFFLVVIISIVLSMHQEKVNENIRLTSEYFNKENENLSLYTQKQFGVGIKAAMKDVKNIDESLRNLKKFFDKFF
jgi:hypothetical protein